VGRILAVDLGSTRVGLALTDPLGMIASPFDTVPFHSMSSLAERVEALCRDKAVDRVVVGLPVRENGSEGVGCQKARYFASLLEGHGIPCVLWDESWSSRDAEIVVRAYGKTRKTAREKVDAIAAALFLSDYLQSGAS
jgi:putative Holliday junction resolvase